MTGYIYQIINKVTQSIYIGSTFSYKKRIDIHIKSLIDNKHYNYKLQNDYNLYKGNFNVIVLEEIKDCTKELLINKEQYYLDTYKPFYNILEKAYSPVGYKHTTEAKEKIRQANYNKDYSIISKKLLGVKKSKIHCKNISIGKKGKRMSLDSITKMRITKLEANFHHSEKTKKELSKIMMGKNAGNNNWRSKPIIQFTIDLKFVKEWNSRGEIDRMSIYTGSNIAKSCYGNPIYPHPYNFIWKFKKDVMKDEKLRKEYLKIIK